MAPPPYDKFQLEAIDSIAAALKRGENALLVSPTGSGKTGMLLTSAFEYLGSCEPRPTADDPAGLPRALVLTHRLNLFNQLVKPRANRPCDVEYWTGVAPGRIADKANGGADQDSLIVVGMIQTVANAIDLENAGKKGGIDLRKYRLVVIDEAHHAVEAPEVKIDLEPVPVDRKLSINEQYARRRERLAAEAKQEEAARRAERLIYKKVIDWAERNGALVLGGTATAFRTNEEESLDARLENAHQHHVAYHEAIAAGRIVPTRTQLSEIDLGDGETTESIYVAAAQTSGPIAGAAAVTRAIAEAKKRDRDGYLKAAIDQWVRGGTEGKTLWFCDSVPEAKRVAELINEKTKVPAAAVYAAAGSKTNDRLMEDYEKGKIQVLVSCRLIGEGYDVPDTDRVVVGCTEPPRGWLMQMAGRAMRAAPGKTFAGLLDLGAASLRDGKLEERIEGERLGAELKKLGERSPDSIRTDLAQLFDSAKGRTTVLEIDSGALVIRRLSADCFRVIKVSPNSKLQLHGTGETSPIHGRAYWSALEMCMFLEKQARLEPARLARAFADDRTLSTVRRGLRNRMCDKADAVLSMEIFKEPKSRGEEELFSRACRQARAVSWTSDSVEPLKNALRDRPSEHPKELLVRHGKALLGLSLASHGRRQVPGVLLDQLSKAVVKGNVDADKMAELHGSIASVLVADRLAAPAESAAARALGLIRQAAARYATATRASDKIQMARPLHSAVVKQAAHAR